MATLTHNPSTQQGPPSRSLQSMEKEKEIEIEKEREKEREREKEKDDESEEKLIITHNNGSLHFKPNLADNSLTGGWRASLFIIWFGMIERMTYYGILSNLITYLTTKLREGTSVSAENVNAWTGVTSMVSILGAFVVDAYIGRFHAIALMSTVYILGLIFLTLSVTIPPFKAVECDINNSTCPEATTIQVASFFISLYLISISIGVVKPCLEAFGADQFNDTDPAEKRRKSSYFSCWYVAFHTGRLLAVTLVLYIQDTMGWGASFGMITVALGISFILFLVGTPFYRKNAPSRCPFTSIAQVLVAAVCKWNVKVPDDSALLYEKYEKDSLMQGGRRRLLHTKEFRFLDKAATMVSWKQSQLITDEELNAFLMVGEKDNSDATSSTNSSSINPWKLCSITQVEEVKLIFRVVPIWIISFMYGVVAAQTSTLFTKQGSTMDRRISPNFSISAASLLSFTSVPALLMLPIYARVFIPIARRITGNERGMTLLQRIGVGMFLVTVMMITAAMIEMRRLKIAEKYDLIDKPEATIPMTIFWLLPQYLILGVSDVFFAIGMQEFLYNEMPDAMRSIGMALFLCIFGVGSFLSSSLIAMVDTITREYGGQSWFVNNLNRCHFDYFYWLLAALNSLVFCLYLMLACSHSY